MMGLLNRLKTPKRSKISAPIAILSTIYQYKEAPISDPEQTPTIYEEAQYEEAGYEGKKLATYEAAERSPHVSHRVESNPIAIRYEDTVEDRQPYIQPLPQTFHHEVVSYRSEEQKPATLVYTPALHHERSSYPPTERKAPIQPQAYTPQSKFSSHSCTYCINLSHFVTPPERCPYTGQITMDSDYIQVVKSLLDLGKPEDETADEEERMRSLDNRKILWVVDSGLKAWGESMNKGPRDNIKSWLNNCAWESGLGFLREHRGHDLKENVEWEWRKAVLGQEKDMDDGEGGQHILGLERMGVPEGKILVSMPYSSVPKSFSSYGRSCV